MTKTVIASILAAALAAPAMAQPGQIALDVFLEQRVPDELAAEGTLLSRLGVALDIEVVGDKLIVSLVDPATRRAIASTKVDSVPADREAAVGAVVQVVANLAAQVTTKPAADASTTAVLAALHDDRRERQAREDAEYRFRQEAISFGSEIAVVGNKNGVSTVRDVVAYQGDMRRRLAGRDMYLALGREDLADTYTRRKVYGWVGLLAGGTVALVGAGVYAYDPCLSVSLDDWDACRDDWDARSGAYETAGAVMMIGGTVGMLVGAYYLWRPHPVDENELYDIAARHNAELRTKYGLPVAQLRRPRKVERTWALTPYATGSGGGFSLAGRF